MISDFDKEKFKQLLHYVISKCGSLDNFGKTVLWKLVYFSDFDYYELYEEMLTGESYSKLERGPAPIHFDEVIKELKEEKKIKGVKVAYKGFTQNKFVSLREPDISSFCTDELAVVDMVIKRLSSMNATQISGYSHLDMPWKATSDKEIINYELVFYRDDVTSVREYDGEDC